MNKKIRDFTLEKYMQLLKAISENNVITVSEYFNNERKDNFIIIRHDVDLDIHYALRMALIENEQNIKSTYYIRFKKNIIKPKIIKKISELGHEIGYHYEVLSKSKGNFIKAKEIFNNEISELRKLVDVKTVTMHGSPLSPYTNTDFWKHYQYEEFGLLGDAQLCIKNVHYFTDTGGLWNSSNNLNDFITNNLATQKNINTDNLIKILKENINSNIYINSHPERWAKEYLDIIKIKTRDQYYNTGKAIYKSIIKKFYF